VSDHLEYAGRHPPKPPDEEELFEEDELYPLEFPPIPPLFEDVERRVIVPVVSDVLGRTEEPGTGLFWKAPLVYDLGW
jgi:hypothetical protein